MSFESTAPGNDVAGLVSEIVSAYVSNNSVPMQDLPGLIANVHAAISGLDGDAVARPAPEPVEKPSAAQIRKSITNEGIVSFIDGKTYQTLKRHLSKHGLEPHAYRERYGLPADYPMTAAGYSARRSELARTIGLGQGGRQAERAPEPVPAPAPKKRGRSKAGAG